ncbi:MlaA family lipoprotein [Noviherbaspirillum sp.]|jgi:phospholipid-binding lipoprotein MlaA|uniref:MlaA family lipoprotein n=1 Tax=Noviherbaspirillum sp. TaxID=1926288 RepID=UPI0039C9CB92
MLQFNDALDQVALKPAATMYDKLPRPLKTGIANVFGNLVDAWTAVNNLLQGKVGDGLSDMMRVAVNSTFGLGGVLDIASEARIPKHKEDFGQTLGKWGVPAGPYVVLPFFGPSTFRDGAAMPVDLSLDPLARVVPSADQPIAFATRSVDGRASLLIAAMRANTTFSPIRRAMRSSQLNARLVKRVATNATASPIE